MKTNLAIVLAVVTSWWMAAAWTHAPQQTGPAGELPQSSASSAGQQGGTPPPPPQPCAESKDTCELSEPAPSQPERKTASDAEKTQKSKAVPLKQAKRRHRKAAKGTGAADTSGPKRTVVRQGSTSDQEAVLTPGATAHTPYSRQMTADLLSATDANLKQATSRPLKPDQEETVTQIKIFMDQANAAMKAGDLDRGHNLAMKAHLLSDDLVKH